MSTHTEATFTGAPVKRLRLESGKQPRTWLTHGRSYFLIIGIALVAGVASLSTPTTPSYDPWCWIIWGREILHGQLHLTNGASWKPLPVLFTTPFALFGESAPNLWVAVARTGFIVVLLMGVKLSWRLTLMLAPTRSGAGLSEKLVRYAPAFAAAAATVIGIAVFGPWQSDSLLGYSEGVAVAALLIAFERHIDGHRRQAFAIGLLVALDRPETWLFWGLYGLWLMWRDPGSRKVVIGVAVLCLLLWFPPQKWGGGSWFAGLSRAQQVRANSPALAHDPFGTEMTSAWRMLALQINWGAILVGSAALILLLAGVVISRRAKRANDTRSQRRTRDAEPSGLFVGTQRQALGATLALTLFGFLWLGLIALMTQLGFSGNNRYLVLGVAAINVAGGIFIGALAMAAGRLGGRFLPATRLRFLRALLVLAAALGAVALFLFVPTWFGKSMSSLPRLRHIQLYQAQLRTDVKDGIAKLGGPEAISKCGAGNFMIEGFQVPMAAWYLHRSIDETEAQPAGYQPPPNLAWPNVIMQMASTRSAPDLPWWSMINGWKQNGAKYKVIQLPASRVFEDCSFQPNAVPAESSL
ncbi:MAG: hypothetical protein J2O48_06680 [Solirubrobacterales bacterium]|nr:hypothetical protein [Solirubrobacterales bacterium]